VAELVYAADLKSAAFGIVGSSPTGATMKLTITENGITLEPETDFERHCIEKIADKVLTAKFENDWDRKGALKLEYQPHPWN